MNSRTVVLAGMLAAAAIAVAGSNGYLPGGGDNAAYIAVAEGWRAEGRPAMLHVAGAPNDPLHPPLFSLMLAGVESLCGRNLIAMKVLLALFAAATVWAAWFVLQVGMFPSPNAGNGKGTIGVPRAALPLAARAPLSLHSPQLGEGTTTAAAIAFWFALCPLLTRLTHDILADVPFAFCALLALGLVGRAVRPGASPWHLAGAVAALLVATALRSAGLLVIGASLCWFVIEAFLGPVTRRKWLLAGAATLLVVAAGAALYLLPREAEYYGAAAAEAAPGNGALERLARVVTYYGVFLPGEFAGYDGFGPYYPLPALGALLSIAGLVVLLRRGQRLVPVCFLAYQAALIMYLGVRSAYQAACPAELRYDLPIVPLYLCLVWCGARGLLEWCEAQSRALGAVVLFLLALCPMVSLVGSLVFFGQPAPGPATVVEWAAAAVALCGLCFWAGRAGGSRIFVTAVAIVLLLAATRSISENVIRERRRGPAPDGPGWTELYAASLWLKNRVPLSAVVISAKPSLVWFWSGVPGEMIPPAAGTPQARQVLAKAQWAILDDLQEDALAARVLQPMLAAEREQWEVRWRQENTVVLGRK